MKTTHKNILRFIKVSRESFPQASIIYTFGGCYGFHQILKLVFPSAIAYQTTDGDHVVSKIGNRLYDIDGECVNGLGKTFDDYTRMTPSQIDHWEGVALAQDIGMVLSKYRSYGKKIEAKHK